MGKVREAEPVATAARELVELPVPSAPARSRASAFGLIVAAAVVPYVDTLRGGFVFDDHELIVANPMATPGMHAWDWFLRPSTSASLYRPVTMLTYALDGALGGTAGGFHVTNVLLHVAASLAALAVALRLLPRRRDALVAGLLFAVHPVHTEAVANLAGRAELLAALFALAAVYAVVAATERPRWCAVAFVATLLGAFSKESAVTIPLLATIALGWTGVRRHPRRIALAAASVLAPCALYVGARHAVVGSLGLRVPPPFVDNPLAYVAAPERIATALVVLVDYLGVLALPIRLSADDTFDQVPVVTSAVDVRLLAAVAVLVLAGVVAFRARRKAPGAWHGFVFFLAALAITSNVLLPIGTIEAERLVYLPAFGFCIAAAALAGVASDRVGVRTIAVVVLALGVRTWIRNADWRDDYDLFTATALTSPNSARAQSNAGAVYAQHAEFDEALLHYENATRIRPTFVPAQIGVGRLLAMQGRSAEALAAFDAARHGDTPSVEAHLRAGDLRLEMGDAAGAETTYRDGLSASPADPELRLGIATAVAALGRRDEAIAIRDAVERDAGAALTARVAPRLAALDTALAR